MTNKEFREYCKNRREYLNSLDNFMGAMHDSYTSESLKRELKLSDEDLKDIKILKSEKVFEEKAWSFFKEKYNLSDKQIKKIKEKMEDNLGHPYGYTKKEAEELEEKLRKIDWSKDSILQMLKGKPSSIKTFRLGFNKKDD